MISACIQAELPFTCLVLRPLPCLVDSLPFAKQAGSICLLTTSTKDQRLYLSCLSSALTSISTLPTDLAEGPRMIFSVPGPRFQCEGRREPSQSRRRRMKRCHGDMHVSVMLTSEINTAIKFLLKFCIGPITCLIGLEGTFQKIFEGRKGRIHEYSKEGRVGHVGIT
ncbi:hypothetical protein ARMSODRAFT_209073 [Armillaria solidipes]|uniref:Uncharacterized protein n=1 Tax=Armillaria solidipes TaxID=1076256 RepID=A0A2H3BBD5_9AGAR|nr:hypothetical protein ARMSODRAFT_209073 [Armillaria solidipes]